jgi:prefoldin subunit 5
MKTAQQELAEITQAFTDLSNQVTTQNQQIAALQAAAGAATGIPADVQTAIDNLDTIALAADPGAAGAGSNSGAASSNTAANF